MSPENVSFPTAQPDISPDAVQPPQPVGDHAASPETRFVIEDLSETLASIGNLALRLENEQPGRSGFAEELAANPPEADVDYQPTNLGTLLDRLSAAGAFGQEDKEAHLGWLAQREMARISQESLLGSLNDDDEKSTKGNDKKRRKAKVSSLDGHRKAKAERPETTYLSDLPKAS
jgi:hypothetical protein